MIRERRRRDALRDLVLNVRSAAAQIESAYVRRIAAREADRIPLTMIEKAHGKRGALAKLARQIMRRLPELEREHYADTASLLRHCADAIDSRFEVTSEIELGKRPKGRAA